MKPDNSLFDMGKQSEREFLLTFDTSCSIAI
jgi:hypothetical protein